VSLDAPPKGRSGTAWRIALVGLVTAIVVAAQLAYGNRHHFFDLGIYRDAMLWWADGHPLYDFSRPDATQGQLEFTYPPFAAMLLLGLAWLTWTQTIWLFTLVSVAALAATMWWLVRPVADRNHTPGWFAFAIAFVLATGLEPVREAFTLGQINFVLWALIVFDLIVLLPRGSRFAGIGIGLATAIKLIPGIFIVYLLVTRRWRAAGVAIGTAGATTLVAAAIAPRESFTFFTEKLLHGEGVGQLSYTFNQSLMGTIARLAFPDRPSQPIWLLLAVPVLGYGLWRAARAAAAGDEVAGLTLTGIVGSLVSPVTWVHHIVWFVPALLVLVDAALRPADVAGGLRGRAGNAALAVVTYVTVTFSILSLWDFTLGEPGGPLGFVMSNWLVLLMLVLLAALPIRRLRR
jgi:alpha-1,2-mannosyltransferase